MNTPEALTLNARDGYTLQALRYPARHAQAGEGTGADAEGDGQRFHQAGWQQGRAPGLGIGHGRILAWRCEGFDKPRRDPMAHRR